MSRYEYDFCEKRPDQISSEFKMKYGSAIAKSKSLDSPMNPQTLPHIGKVRYRILNILERFMLLPEKEINEYQADINKKLGRILSEP